MSRNALILSATLLAIAAALGWRAQHSSVSVAPASTDETLDVLEARPRLVELGSDSCASCQAMMPVLDELRLVNHDELDVDFIDVWKFPDQAEPFAVHLIPTQVFLAPDGTELARHEGFYPAEEIRARWSSLGYPLTNLPSEL